MGRTAGTPNKHKKALESLLKRHLGQDFEPLLKIAQNADFLQKELDRVIELSKADPELGPSVDDVKDVNEEWARLAPYLQPKLKALEVSTDEESLPFTRIELVVTEPAREDS